MIRAVVRKELAVLWASPLPYAVAIVFNAVAGVLFVDQLVGRRQAVVQPLFPIAGFLLVVLVPVLTMRAIADEERSGTLDVLQSIPVQAATLVAGKWIGVVSTAAAVVAPCLLMPLLLSWWGDPDWGPVVTGFLGLALVVAATAAIGLLASACTSAQAVAAIVAMFVGLVLWFAQSTQTASAAGAVARLSISDRLHSFAGGAIDSADAGFFVLITVSALVAATVCVDARRR
ncbi:MAG TPA: ABC transporter permease subunit [Acidimicrobiales bacterium]|jgi:ABC-2 type transport system permease protein|nr:ABC transporter permease subunit [Acidimicrobiales bacterium]